MGTHIYLTGQAHGVNGTSSVARVNINRQTDVISDTTGWLISVERLIMNKILLPLFDPNLNTPTISFQNIGSGAVTSEVVDFSAYDDTDGYIYDYHDVASAISNTFDSLCTTLSIADVPTMTFDETTNKFSINSVVAFRNAWKIGLNNDLFTYMPTFNYESVLSSPYYVELSSDTDSQYVATLELMSPVSRIVIRSNLPTVNELLPPPFNQPDAVAGSADTASFLVDFDVQQANNQPVSLIKYSARDKDHVWHNFKESRNINSFYLDFYWYDYNNVGHPIALNANSQIDIKLYFVQQ